MTTRLNFNRKGLIFVVFVLLLSAGLATYALYYQRILHQTFTEITSLTDSSNMLEKAQLSAFNAVAELIVLFQTESHQQAVDLTHEKFIA